MSKPTRIKGVTPRGVAVYPKLNEPDTKFDADGVYNVKLAFDADDKAGDKFIEQLEEMRDNLYADFLKEKPTNKKFKPAPVFTEELDKETGDETGRRLINFKMKASGVSKKTKKPWTMQPLILDAKKTVLKNPPKIGGGSTLRVSFEAYPAPVDSSKQFYLGLRLNGVQIIELVEFGMSADSLGFDEEEGYEADTTSLREAVAGASAEDGDDEAGGGDF